MGITGGFGTTMDLERGTTRKWVMGRDGVKRWADTGEPVPLDDLLHNAALRGDSGLIAGVPLESTVMQQED